MSLKHTKQAVNMTNLHLYNVSQTACIGLVLRSAIRRNRADTKTAKANTLVDHRYLGSWGRIDGSPLTQIRNNLGVRGSQSYELVQGARVCGDAAR